MPPPQSKPCCRGSSNSSPGFPRFEDRTPNYHSNLKIQSKNVCDWSVVNDVQAKRRGQKRKKGGVRSTMTNLRIIHVSTSSLPNAPASTLTSLGTNDDSGDGENMFVRLRRWFQHDGEGQAPTQGSFHSGSLPPSSHRGQQQLSGERLASSSEHSSSVINPAKRRRLTQCPASLSSPPAPSVAPGHVFNHDGVPATRCQPSPRDSGIDVDSPARHDEADCWIVTLDTDGVAAVSDNNCDTTGVDQKSTSSEFSLDSVSAASSASSAGRGLAGAACRVSEVRGRGQGCQGFVRCEDASDDVFIAADDIVIAAANCTPRLAKAGSFYHADNLGNKWDPTSFPTITTAAGRGQDIIPANGRHGSHPVNSAMAVSKRKEGMRCLPGSGRGRGLNHDSVTRAVGIGGRQKMARQVWSNRRSLPLSAATSGMETPAGESLCSAQCSNASFSFSGQRSSAFVSSTAPAVAPNKRPNLQIFSASVPAASPSRRSNASTLLFSGVACNRTNRNLSGAVEVDFESPGRSTDARGGVVDLTMSDDEDNEQSSSVTTKLSPLSSNSVNDKLPCRPEKLCGGIEAKRGTGEVQKGPGVTGGQQAVFSSARTQLTIPALNCSGDPSVVKPNSFVGSTNPALLAAKRASGFYNHASVAKKPAPISHDKIRGETELAAKSLGKESAMTGTIETEQFQIETATNSLNKGSAVTVQIEAVQFQMEALSRESQQADGFFADLFHIDPATPVPVGLFYVKRSLACEPLLTETIVNQTQLMDRVIDQSQATQRFISESFCTESSINDHQLCKLPLNGDAVTETSLCEPQLTQPLVNKLAEVQAFLPDSSQDKSIVRELLFSSQMTRPSVALVIKSPHSPEFLLRCEIEAAATHEGTTERDEHSSTDLDNSDKPWVLAESRDVATRNIFDVMVMSSAADPLDTGALSGYDVNKCNSSAPCDSDAVLECNVIYASPVVSCDVSDSDAMSCTMPSDVEMVPQCEQLENSTDLNYGFIDQNSVIEPIEESVRSLQFSAQPLNRQEMLPSSESHGLFHETGDTYCVLNEANIILSSEQHSQMPFDYFQQQLTLFDETTTSQTVGRASPNALDVANTAVPNISCAMVLSPTAGGGAVAAGYAEGALSRTETPAFDLSLLLDACARTRRDTCERLMSLHGSASSDDSASPSTDDTAYSDNVEESESRSGAAGAPLSTGMVFEAAEMKKAEFVSTVSGCVEAKDPCADLKSKALRKDNFFSEFARFVASSEFCSPFNTGAMSDSDSPQTYNELTKHRRHGSKLSPDLCAVQESSVGTQILGIPGTCDPQDFHNDSGQCSYLSDSQHFGSLESLYFDISSPERIPAVPRADITLRFASVFCPPPPNCSSGPGNEVMPNSSLSAPPVDFSGHHQSIRRRRGRPLKASYQNFISPVDLSEYHQRDGRRPGRPLKASCQHFNPLISPLPCSLYSLSSTVTDAALTPLSSVCRIDSTKSIDDLKEKGVSGESVRKTLRRKCPNRRYLHADYVNDLNDDDDSLSVRHTKYPAIVLQFDGVAAVRVDRKLVALRSKACELLRDALPGLVYPPRFSEGSPAVERLLDDIIGVLTGEGGAGGVGGGDGGVMNGGWVSGHKGGRHGVHDISCASRLNRFCECVCSDSNKGDDRHLRQGDSVEGKRFCCVEPNKLHELRTPESNCAKRNGFNKPVTSVESKRVTLNERSNKSFAIRNSIAEPGPNVCGRRMELQVAVSQATDTCVARLRRKILRLIRLLLPHVGELSGVEAKDVELLVDRVVSANVSQSSR